MIRAVTSYSLINIWKCYEATSLAGVLNSDLNWLKNLKHQTTMKCLVVAGDLLCVGLDHDVAVDEDGADDGEWEQGMSEHVDGNPG